MSSPAEKLTPETGRQVAEVNLPDTARDQMRDVQGMVVMARGFTVESQEDYNEAADLRKQLKSRRKVLDDERKKVVQPLDKIRQTVQGWFKPALDAIDSGVAVLDRNMGTWYQEQERKRREAERRIREQQEREAEQARKNAEKKAERLRAKGDEDRAQEVIDQVEQAPPPPAPVLSGPNQPEGTHARKYYKAEVVDKRKLIAAVAAGEVPDDVLVPDMKVLNGLARSLKQSLKYPGVRVVEDTKPVTRG